VLALVRGRVLENSDWFPVKPDPLEAESELTQAAVQRVEGFRLNYTITIIDKHGTNFTFFLILKCKK